MANQQQQEIDVPTSIEVRVSSEYGILRTVVMRLAAPFTLDLDHSEHFNRGFQRQLEHNRWQSYDHRVVRDQQQVFIETMRARGIDVLLAADVPGCDGQHYTRGIGFAIDGVFFVGRPRLAVRQRELIGLRPLVERMSKVAYLDCGTIEGGDVILHEGKVIVGLGEETSGSGIDSLEYRLRTLGNDREVVRIEFSRRGVVHLDTLFNVVSGNTALIHRTAFAKESLEWLEAHFDLIDVTDAEFLNVEVNTFTLDPTTVVVARGSERIGAELQRRGIEPVFIDYSEVTRIPGSFRCSTMPLTRADP